MPSHGLADKALGGWKISATTEREFNSGARLVDGAVEIVPLASNLDMAQCGKACDQ